jgi:hypothetical protein
MLAARLVIPLNSYPSLFGLGAGDGADVFDGGPVAFDVAHLQNSFKTRGGRERGKGCTTEPTQSSSAAWSIESESALAIVLINLRHPTSLPFSAPECSEVSLPPVRCIIIVSSSSFAMGRGSSVVFKVSTFKQRARHIRILRTNKTNIQ